MAQATRLTARSPPRPMRAATQDEKLQRLGQALARGNRFYRDRFAATAWSPGDPFDRAMLERVPFTTKDDLVADQARFPPFGGNLGAPLSAFTRFHQTSGTTGSPLRWLDTPDSWRWWLLCWRHVLTTAGVTQNDRVLVAFSFGPFIGFWAAFEAVQELGALAVPGGGLTSEQRLDTVDALGITVVISTPTYALRLAEVARDGGRDLAGGSVRITLHAGEPGASLPAVKARLEAAWGARCVDHAGATEVGAWGVSCGVADHLHLNESEFLVEVVDPDTGALRSGSAPVVEGELVLTNLGRLESPVIRYRTGDLVALSRAPCDCGRSTAFLPGGVRGRRDGMIVIRGVNVFPSAVENIVRQSDAVAEFEVHVGLRRQMREMAVQIEVDSTDPDGEATRLATRLRESLGLRARVEVVPRGSLPRHELKARRFHVETGP
ncbi:MAG: phenylacetate--CoA ligase family protein [Acidobacteriota bacterium]